MIKVLINLAEKGFASFRLIVETTGGHSSQPPRENTIGMLAQAIVDLENNQLPYKLVKPVDYQLEYMGAELSFLKKMAFANPWLFKKPILEALNAHTTTALSVSRRFTFLVTNVLAARSVLANTVRVVTLNNA